MSDRLGTRPRDNVSEMTKLLHVCKGFVLRRADTYALLQRRLKLLIRCSRLCGGCLVSLLHAMHRMQHDMAGNRIEAAWVR